MPSFNTWIDTLISEKGIDREQNLEVMGPGGLNIMPVGVVIDAMKSTSPAEQHNIKSMIVRIDFRNGDVLDYIKHLAQAIAR